MQATRGASLTDFGPTSTSSVPTDTPQRRLRLFAAVTTAAYAADLITKVMAVRLLSDDQRVTVVPQLLRLSLTRNPGAAFSMAAGMTVVLTVVALGVALLIARMAQRLRDPVWAVALGMLLGGALGNLTDRLLREPGPLRGHVVDFLQVPHWPVFNVADSCIVVAAALILVQAARGVGPEGRGSGPRSHPPT